jgi:hypothetical protein
MDIKDLTIIYTLSINGINHIDSCEFNVIDAELRKMLKENPDAKCTIRFIAI